MLWFFNFLFWNNFRFAEELQRQGGELLHILPLAAPPVNILHDQSTLVTSKKFLITQPSCF